jgi:hypothetical protein
MKNSKIELDHHLIETNIDEISIMSGVNYVGQDIKNNSSNKTL